MPTTYSFTSTGYKDANGNYGTPPAPAGTVLLIAKADDQIVRMYVAAPGATLSVPGEAAVSWTTGQVIDFVPGQSEAFRSSIEKYGFVWDPNNNSVTGLIPNKITLTKNIWNLAGKIAVHANVGSARVLVGGSQLPGLLFGCFATGETSGNVFDINFTQQLADWCAVDGFLASFLSNEVIFKDGFRFTGVPGITLTDAISGRPTVDNNSNTILHDYTLVPNIESIYDPAYSNYVATGQVSLSSVLDPYGNSLVDSLTGCLVSHDVFNTMVLPGKWSKIAPSASIETLGSQLTENGNLSAAPVTPLDSTGRSKYFVNGRPGTGMYKTCYFVDGLPGRGVSGAGLGNLYLGAQKISGVANGRLYKNGAPYAGVAHLANGAHTAVKATIGMISEIDTFSGTFFMPTRLKADLTTMYNKLTANTPVFWLKADDTCGTLTYSLDSESRVMASSYGAGQQVIWDNSVTDFSWASYGNTLREGVYFTGGQPANGTYGGKNYINGQLSAVSGNVTQY